MKEQRNWMKRTVSKLLAFVLALAVALPSGTPPKVWAEETPNARTMFHYNGYPYGEDMIQAEDGGVKLAVSLKKNATSIRWEYADSKDAASWTTLPDATTTTISINESSNSQVFPAKKAYDGTGKWIRCVADDVPSEAVQLFYLNTDDAASAGHFVNDWSVAYNKVVYYISNGSMAYSVGYFKATVYDGKNKQEQSVYGFNVIGKYQKDGKSYWMQTSYGNMWGAISKSGDNFPEQKKADYGTNSAFPLANNEEAINKGVEHSIDIENYDSINNNIQYIRPYFIPGSDFIIPIDVKLKEEQRYFAFGTDVMLSNKEICGMTENNRNIADYAFLKADLSTEGVLKKMQLIGALDPSGVDTRSDIPAMVIDFYTSPMSFNIDEYSSVMDWSYRILKNNDDMAKYISHYEKNREYIVTELRSVDSGMSVAYDAGAGGLVQFAFRIGSVADTGADIGEATKKQSYSIAFDANGGSDKMFPATAKEGAEYILPDCLLTPPTDKVFAGWSVGSAEGEVKKPGEKITITADTTLYPRWKTANKLPATINTLTGKNGTYNGLAHDGYVAVPTVTAEDGSAISDALEKTYYIKVGDAFVKTTADNSGAAGEGQAPTYAGTYRVEFHLPDSSAYEASASTEFTIAPVEVGITGLCASDKIYDGNTNATISGTPALTGVLASDSTSVSLNYTGGVFADKNVGANKNVTLTGCSLTGAAAGNYKLSDTISSLTASITPKTISATATAVDRLYNGETNVDISGTLQGVESGDAVTIANVTGQMADAKVGENKPVSGIQFTLSGTDAGNYTLTQPTTPVLVTISKKPLTLTSLQAEGANSNTIIGGDFLGLAKDETLTYGVDYEITNSSVAEWKASGTVSLKETEKAANYIISTPSFRDIPVQKGKIVVKDLDPKTDAPKTTVTAPDGMKQYLSDHLLTDVQKKNLQNGTDFEIFSEITKLESEQVSKADQEKIAAIAEVGTEELKYIDISLYFKQADTTEKTEIHNTGSNKWTFTLNVKDYIKNDVPTGKHATNVKVLAYHTGESVAWDTSDKNYGAGSYNERTGEYTFTTTKFSTYAISYKLEADNAGGGGSYSGGGSGSPATPKITPEESEQKPEDKKDDEDKKEDEDTSEIDNKYIFSVKTSDFGKLRARITKTTKNTLKLAWDKTDDADGYIIYGNKCNHNGHTYQLEQIKTVKSNKHSLTLKSLDKATYYKYVVYAYKNVDGKKVIIAKSVVVHGTTEGGKYGLASAVKINKIGLKSYKSTKAVKVTLKKGKSVKVKAEEVFTDKKAAKHRALTLESSNTKVVKITKSGKIKAVGKGTAKIWVYAQNGVYNTITITVK